MKSCPFCGDYDLGVTQVGTARWAGAQCMYCEAIGPPVRTASLREISDEDRRQAAITWNERAPDPLREALLWWWAADRNRHYRYCVPRLHDAPCSTCVQIADMRDTAAGEVARLLEEMK